MTALLTLTAIAVSALGIGWLLSTNAKRRRAFDLPPRQGRSYTALAWAVVLLPGLLLLADGQAAAFVMWLGGAPVVAWLLAACPPARFEAARGRLQASKGWLWRTCRGR